MKCPVIYEKWTVFLVCFLFCFLNCAINMKFWYFFSSWFCFGKQSWLFFSMRSEYISGYKIVWISVINGSAPDSSYKETEKKEFSKILPNSYFYWSPLFTGTISVITAKNVFFGFDLNYVYILFFFVSLFIMLWELLNYNFFF